MKFKWQELRVDVKLNNGGCHVVNMNIWYPMNGSPDAGHWTPDIDLLAALYQCSGEM